VLLFSDLKKSIEEESQNMFNRAVSPSLSLCAFVDQCKNEVLLPGY